MEIKSYTLGHMKLDYLIDETKNVSLRLYPKSMKNQLVKPWEIPLKPTNPRARYSNIWTLGRLGYFHLVGQDTASPGYTMKIFYIDLQMDSQILEESETQIQIKTLLKTKENYQLLHTVTYIKGLGGLKVNTEFINKSGKDVTLDMLTSFSLDNLSPFQIDDAPNTYNFHRFYGGWSKEGKHICQSIEDINMEKAWSGFQNCNNNEKFGSFGSYPTRRFFSTAAFEDKKTGVIWGARIAHNCTWQMELTRWDDSLSFTGGLGDRDFCGWTKIIKNGESFSAPTAYIAVAKGDIYDVCAHLNDMLKPAQEEYGEIGIPTSFNEYCATWGKPTQEKMLSYCKVLKPYNIKYLVIDAGWCKAGREQDGNGEWNIDKTIFPDVKAMNYTIRECGMIPGIWFEFEVTTKGSKMFEPEYDFMKLKKDGIVLKTDTVRSYWDFRRDDVREYLYEKVIKFLKDNGFGYIKVDYNANIGIGVDGEESQPEELRKHLEEVRNFFIKMKHEIPDLVIENCASGGHRLEPSMMEVSGVSSFSDAHEAVEIPYLAANLHNLMLPAQMLIWAVLHSDDSKERLAYSLCATFLGRVCLSGEVDKLSEWQKGILSDAMTFYAKLENIIKNGKSRIYGNRSKSMRYPSGVQAVIRQTDDEILVVYHAFEADINSVKIPIPKGFKKLSEFFGDCFNISDESIVINNPQPFTAGAVLLKKETNII